jgi:hypothetical protein
MAITFATSTETFRKDYYSSGVEIAKGLKTWLNALAITTFYSLEKFETATTVTYIVVYA